MFISEQNLETLLISKNGYVLIFIVALRSQTTIP